MRKLDGLKTQFGRPLIGSLADVYLVSVKVGHWYGQCFTCTWLFVVVKDLPAILKTYAVGPALLKSKELDTYKRRELVELLADHLIVKFGRYGRVQSIIFRMQYSACLYREQQINITMIG